MELSDAIRDGAKMSPRISGGLSGRDFKSRSLYGTCALGAAMERCELIRKDLGGLFDHLRRRGEVIYLCDGSAMEKLRVLFPVLVSIKSSPCGCDDLKGDVGSIIAHLNDHHGWSREAIAEWVATIESKLAVHREIPVGVKATNPSGLQQPLSGVRTKQGGCRNWDKAGHDGDLVGSSQCTELVI